MKDFLLSLLFGNMILLTQRPLDIHKSWVSIDLKDPITAITHGASINIELPGSREFGDEIESHEDAYQYLKGMYPFGTIEALLATADGLSVRLKNTDFAITGYGKPENIQVFITLSSESEIPTQIKFVLLKIRSENQLTNVKVHWMNYSK